MRGPENTIKIADSRSAFGRALPALSTTTAPAMQLFRVLISVASLLAAASAAALPTTTAIKPRQDAAVTPVISSANTTAHVIHAFPEGTWLENFAIRQRDGNAVTTFLSAPEVWLISTTSSFPPVKLASFPGNLGVLGITEMGHDVFYVAVGNWSAHLAEATPGSWSIWSIDLRNFTSPATSDPLTTIATHKITTLPTSGFLNGMTALNPTTLLVADSLLSTIWSIDTLSGAATPILTAPALAPQPALASLALGINGLTVRCGHVYFTNTDTATFHRVAVDPRTGAARGPVETLAQSAFPSVIFDDFALDFAGNAWVASGVGEVVLLHDVVGSAAGGEEGEEVEVRSIDIVAGGAEDVRVTGHTAVKFGTSQEDLRRGSLYATTSGGALAFITGNFTTGGMLVRYDVGELYA